MSTKTEIANLALRRIGISQLIDDLDTDESNEADDVNAVFEIMRGYVIRDFHWPFARKYTVLELASDPDVPPNNDWLFAYRYPVDCAQVRRIVDCTGRQNCSPAPYVIGRDAIYAESATWDEAVSYVAENSVRYLGVVYVAVDASTGETPVDEEGVVNSDFWEEVDPRLIFTNQEAAAIEYTVDVPDVGDFDPIAASMLAWKIAIELAPSRGRIENILARAQEQYKAEKGDALTRALAEGEYAVASGEPDPRVRDIFNLALTRIGVARNAIMVDPELSFAVLWPRVCFHDERDFVLRDFPWAFATKYTLADADPLRLIAGSQSAPFNKDWRYVYEMPDDCLFVRRIVTCMGRRDYRPRAYRAGRNYSVANADDTITIELSAGDFSAGEDITLTASEDLFSETEVGNTIELTDGTDTIRLTITEYVSATEVVGVNADEDVPAGLQDTPLDGWTRIFDGPVIYSNEREAQIEYTREVTDPDEFSSSFVSLLAWRLAALLAPSIAKIDKNREIAQMAFQMYEMEKSRVQRQDLNEAQQEEEPDAEWIRDR